VILETSIKDGGNDLSGSAFFFFTLRNMVVAQLKLYFIRLSTEIDFSNEQNAEQKQTYVLKK
jgi:hypothetical protein